MNGVNALLLSLLFALALALGYLIYIDGDEIYEVHVSYFGTDEEIEDFEYYKHYKQTELGE